MSEANPHFPQKMYAPRARWSSGQDGGLSRRKQEFDSPTGHQISSTKSIDKYSIFVLHYLSSAAKKAVRNENSTPAFSLLTFFFLKRKYNAERLLTLGSWTFARFEWGFARIGANDRLAQCSSRPKGLARWRERDVAEPVVCREQVGVYGGEGPPVPIPNTAVKLTCADNTRTATSRKDKSTPTFRRALEQSFRGFSLFEREGQPVIRYNHLLLKCLHYHSKND